MRLALADDLDTPRALAAVDRWAADAANHRGRMEGAPGLLRDAVDALLGVRLQS
jgi:L-cysteine:1D-myo-inositol 2-amino-2-deoxy-alpha-D-glucopyranoside ligase